MAIFLTENSKVIVQGMTGSEGSKHTRRMLAAGTNIVGGVNPRKAGQQVDFDGTRCRSSAPSPRPWRRPARTSRWSSYRRVRQGRRGRGDRRRDPAGRGDHRGHPGARHRRVLRVRAAQATTRIIGPELSRA